MTEKPVTETTENMEAMADQPASEPPHDEPAHSNHPRKRKHKKKHYLLRLLIVVQKNCSKMLCFFDETELS